MAESVVEATVSLALESIRDLVIEEAKFLGEVKGQAEQLQQELGHIQWFLKDAEAKKVDKERIKKWVMEFKEIAYDAEDVLESYAFKIGSRRQRRGGLAKSLNRCTSKILSETKLKHQVGSQIQDLIKKISDLKENFEKYGVRAIMEGGPSSSRQHQQLRRSYSHVLEGDFVGMGSDIETLVQNLVQEEEEDNNYYKVVSISGMGGLGKTTLAQKIYNHPLVKHHFDASVWICISQEWKTLDILQSILIKLFPKRREDFIKLGVDELVRELFNALSNGKKTIFVLDDIWEIDAWESIKQAFHKKNSKILLTTRNKDVALAIGPNGFHHQPRLLNEEESWELFQKKSFLNSGKGKDIEDFEALGREMVKHCGGLPLAVIVLGGILATKHSKDEWQNVLENIKYFLGGKGKGDDHQAASANLEDILALSYDDLPPRLKPCFLYMAAFSEDESIDVELLYHMWMAEGLVSMEDKRGEEEVLINVAERYLGELVQRCMVQVEAKIIPMIIKFESCRLHDIMRDLCIKKAGDENFIQCIHNDEQRVLENVHTSSRIRRLKLTIDSENAIKHWPLPHGMEKHARSLQLNVLDAEDYRVVPLIKTRLKAYKLLRVLTIDGLDLFENESDATSVLYGLWDNFSLPKSIGKLSHLRFLKMTDSEFFKLPAGVLCKLEHLQTLDLGGLSTTIISKAALQDMGELRYLYLPEETVDNFWPLNLVRLHSLHKLEVLENFDPSYCNAQDLSRLNSLVQLHARVSKQLSDVTDIVIGVSNLSHLKHLSLEIRSFPSETQLNEERSTSLTQLFDYSCLISKLPVGPDASKFSRVLKVLKLTGLSIQQNSIETLEKLSNLQELHINWCRSAEEITFHSNGFPQLKVLELSSFQNLKKWMVDEGAMPNLFDLLIGNCEKLKMIPDGLRLVNSLKKLSIYRMSTEFMDRVKQVNVNGEEGADFHKISHIPYISIVQ